MLAPSAVQAAVPACGPLTTEANFVPSGARVWSIDGRFVYEYGGGLSFTPNAGATYPFASSDESVVTISPTASSRALVITRRNRGFSAYHWTSSGLTLIYSKTLSFNDYGKSTSGPLVDAFISEGNVYLLENLHLLKLSQADMQAGIYNPMIERFPDCATSNDSTCSRGAGLVPTAGGLALARIRKSTGGEVTMDLATRLDNGPTQLQGFGTTFNPTTDASYFNILKSSNPDIGDFGRLVTYWRKSDSLNGLNGSSGSPLLGHFPDFVVAAQFTNDENPIRGIGVISFKSVGTFIFKDGVPICKAFESTKNPVLTQVGAQLRVSGVNSSGALVTVKVPR